MEAEAKLKANLNKTNSQSFGLSKVSSKAAVGGSRSPKKRDIEQPQPNSRNKKASTSNKSQENSKVAAVMNEKVGPPFTSTDSDVGNMKVDESVRNEMAIIS